MACCELLRTLVNFTTNSVMQETNPRNMANEAAASSPGHIRTDSHHMTACASRVLTDAKWRAARHSRVRPVRTRWIAQGVHSPLFLRCSPLPAAG